MPLADVVLRYCEKHDRHVASGASVRRNLVVMLEALPAGSTGAERTLELQAGVVRTLHDTGYRDGTIKRIMGIQGGDELGMVERPTQGARAVSTTPGGPAARAHPGHRGCWPFSGAPRGRRTCACSCCR
jgi:hypothetical protein